MPLFASLYIYVHIYIFLFFALMDDNKRKSSENVDFFLSGK